MVLETKLNSKLIFIQCGKEKERETVEKEPNLLSEVIVLILGEKYFSKS